MINREKYLKKLKKELDKYTTQLSLIQSEFKGNTGQHVQVINQSLQDILQEAIVAYGRLEAASADEWEPLKAITNQAFNDVKIAFQQKLSASKDQVKMYTKKLDEGYHEQLDMVEKYVRKHPIKSLFFAAGAGFILGKLLK